MTVSNSRYLDIGPGGRRCACCFPAPGSKDRRSQFRRAKRKAEREAIKIELEEMINGAIEDQIEADHLECENDWYDDEPMDPRDFYDEPPFEEKDPYDDPFAGYSDYDLFHY